MKCLHVGKPIMYLVVKACTCMEESTYTYFDILHMLLHNTQKKKIIIGITMYVVY